MATTAASLLTDIRLIVGTEGVSSAASAMRRVADAGGKVDQGFKNAAESLSNGAGGMTALKEAGIITTSALEAQLAVLRELKVAAEGDAVALAQLGAIEENIEGTIGAATHSMDRQSQSSRRAGLFMLNFSRAAEDAKFGLSAVVNNLNELAFGWELMIKNLDEGESVFGALGKTLKTPIGMLAIFNVALTAAVVLGPKIKDAMGGAASGVKELADAIGDLVETEMGLGKIKLVGQEIVDAYDAAVRASADRYRTVPAANSRGSREALIPKTDLQKDAAVLAETLKEQAEKYRQSLRALESLETITGKKATLGESGVDNEWIFERIDGLRELVPLLKDVNEFEEFRGLVRTGGVDNLGMPGAESLRETVALTDEQVEAYNRQRDAGSESAVMMAHLGEASRAATEVLKFGIIDANDAMLDAIVGTTSWSEAWTGMQDVARDALKGVIVEIQKMIIEVVKGQLKIEGLKTAIGGLGLGGILGIGAGVAVLGGLIGAGRGGGSGQSVGSFRDRNAFHGGNMRLQIQPAALPSGDIRFAASEAQNRYNRLGA